MNHQPTVGSIWRHKKLSDITVRVTDACGPWVKLEGVTSDCLPLMTLAHFLRVYEPTL